MKSKKWLSIIIIAVVTSAIFAYCSVPTIDFKKIINIEFVGLNGKGTINSSSNYDAYTSNTSASAREIYKLLNDIEYIFSKETELSNGEEITVRVEYNKEMFKNIHTKNVEFKVKVDGLSDGTKIDVFDGLGVSFSGFSGNGYTLLNTENCNEFTRNNVSFTCDKNKLSNGDKITITANYSSNIAENELIIVENKIKEYTVSGLTEPIEINPFENLEISYTGVSPYLQVVLDASKCDSIINKYIQFTVNDNYLENGDTFTVNAVYNENDAEEYGFIVLNNTKTYTVANQPVYITPEYEEKTPYEESYTGIVITEKDPLNVRKSPSIKAKVIGEIDKGSSVTIYSESDGWYKIKYNSGVGYVSKEFIEISENTSDDIINIQKAISNVTSSSQLKNVDTVNINYSPWNLFDNITSTCWAEGVDGNGENEEIIIELNSLYTINEIKIYNGLQTNSELFYKNSRVKELSLQFSNGEKLQYELNGEWDNCINVLKFNNSINTDYIKLSIISAYNGNKYDDTCISEIVLQ